MNRTLDQTVFRVLGRLDDSDGDVWSRNEVRLYVKDGADLFCRRTRCLFDMAYVENLPAVGNYSSDEEFELAKRIPGLILTNRREFTRPVDKLTALPGLVGPAGLSTHAQIPLLDVLEDAGYDIIRTNPTGSLPRGFVAIERVTHDGITLYPEFSSGLAHEIDNRYEHQEGDSDWFSVDKDGIFTLRRYPAGDARADYEEVRGFWGVDTIDDFLSLASWPMDEASGLRADIKGSYGLSEAGGSVGSAAGIFGLAASFEDNAAYLYNPNLVLGQSGHHGVVWRVYILRSANPSPAQGVATICASGQASNPAWGLRISQTGHVSAFIRDANNTLLHVFPNTGDSVCDGEWHLVVMSYNQYGDRKLRVQVPDFGVDTVSVDTGTADALKADGGGIWVGRSGSGPYPWGDGSATALIDDLTIYDVSNDADTDVIGSWGALAYDPAHFPINGPWGVPVRLHPDTNNTRVELARLNLPLDYHVFDIPDSYLKYVEFWACSRALRRDGPGQDIKLADHYAERFELGVERMLRRRRDVESEHIGRIGHGEQRRGIPLKINLPYNYGVRIRRGSGGY